MYPDTMASLNIPNIVAPGMCSFHHLDLSKEMVDDEHSTVVVIEANKALDVRAFLTKHDPNQVEESLKNDLTSNDTMVQNLKWLDMDNSSSKSTQNLLVLAFLYGQQLSIYGINKALVGNDGFCIDALVPFLSGGFVSMPFS
ncbi:hypothetical protein Ancab_007879 [Ancistrocladus abbreviatus]